MIYKSLFEGGNIWYSFSACMGYNTALSTAFSFFSPFNILYAIFYNKDTNVVTAMIIILKTGLAASAFYLFSSKVLQAKRVISFIFALFYSMCSFVVVYCIVNFIWLDAVYILPIIALAVNDAVHKNKYTLLIISHAYIYIVQFYLGYMISIYSLLFYSVILLVNIKDFGIKKAVSKFFRYFLSIICAIAISGFSWVPVLCNIIMYTASDRTQIWEINHHITSIFNNLFWGQFQNFDYYPYIYCGTVAVILLPFYFFNKNIGKKEKIVDGALLVFFTLACLLDPIMKVMHAFDAPDHWNYRFSFIISFIILCIAVKELNKIERRSFKLYGIWGGLLLVFYTVMIFVQNNRIGLFSSNNLYRLLINSVLICTWIVLLGAYIYKKQFSICLLLILLTMGETISNGYACLYRRGLDLEKMNERLFYSWDSEMREVVELMKNDEAPFSRTIVYGDIMHNGDAYWGYNGLQDFSTSENEKLREFCSKTGLYTMPRGTYASGITPTFEMLLSVKTSYYIYPEERMNNLVMPIKVDNNKYYLPIGFMIDDDVEELSENVFENQNTLFALIAGVDGVFESVHDDNIYEVEQNLLLSPERDRLYLPDVPGQGWISFQVTGVNGDVYIDIIPKEESVHQGYIYYTDTPNAPNSEDTLISYPFAAKMYNSGEDKHYCVIEANEGFSGQFDIQEINVYKLDNEKLNKIYESLNRDCLEVDQCKNGYLKGHISCNDNRKILFTSIPYIEGWSAKVNGVEVETRAVIEGTFLGLELPGSGEYEIELRYHCPGAKLGMALSIVGFVAFLIRLVAIKGILKLFQRRVGN